MSTIIDETITPNKVKRTQFNLKIIQHVLTMSAGVEDDVYYNPTTKDLEFVTSGQPNNNPNSIRLGTVTQIDFDGIKEFRKIVTNVFEVDDGKSQYNGAALNTYPDFTNLKRRFVDGSVMTRQYIKDNIIVPKLHTEDWYRVMWLRLNRWLAFNDLDVNTDLFRSDLRNDDLP